jgi:hypothetical protein
MVAIVTLRNGLQRQRVGGKPEVGNARRKPAQSMILDPRSLRKLSVAAALLLAAAVGGCSSVVDNIPTSMGGLPEGVPQRPATPYAYPAVHDMPPSRKDAAMSEAESKRLREDLKGTRSRVAPPPEAAAAAGAAPNP